MSVRSMKRQIVRNAMQDAGRNGALKCPKCGSALMQMEKVSKKYTCLKCKWIGRIK